MKKMRGRNHVFCLFLFILVLIPFSVSVNAIDAPVITITPEPIIYAQFSEEVFIQSARIYDGVETSVDINTSDNMLFNFTPVLSLNNEVYTFEIKAKDLLNNSDTFSIDFEVNAGETRIILVNPSHGVSSTSDFDLIVRTTRSSNCNYSLLGSYVDISFLNIGAMSVFDRVLDGQRTHIIDDLSIPSDEVTYFYVKCRDVFGTPVSASYELSVLSTKPDLYVYSDPATVVERNPDGTATTEIVVSSDQDVVCKYSDADEPFTQMIYFDDENFNNISSFSNGHRQSITVPGDTLSYTYYVECRNLAELSNRKSVSFNVNLDQGLSIKVNSPKEFSSSQEVTFNITTDESGFCRYRVDSLGSYVQFGEGYPSREHVKYAGTFSAAPHIVEFVCDSQESFGVKRNYNFVIDLSPPTNISFNETNQNSCGKEGDWELNAKWEANDPESGILKYEYAVFDFQGKMIVNWTETNSNEVSVNKDFNGEPLNLTEGRAYYFYVNAQNKAELWSGRNNVNFRSFAITARNASSVYCKESGPPEGWITVVKTLNGANVTLNCRDESGCDMASAKYGFVKLNSSSTCQAETSYTGPVEVLYDGIFCWKVYDLFGNSATGSEDVILTLADSDGDGVPDVNDKCPFTPNTEIFDVDESGCGPSERDSDGDGIKDIYDDCPDSEIGLNASYIDENGCYVDSDSDGMPDFWEDRYGFDKNDPNDANRDDDGDGYTNLIEYQYNTNPLDAEDFPFVDSDKDGVNDLLDRCPNTRAGEKVDSYGCAPYQKDTDVDGVNDQIDECPDTPLGDKVDENGCSVKILPLILLIIGVLMLLGGSGYIVYKKYYMKGQSLQTGNGPYQRKEGLYVTSKVPSFEEKRGILAQKSSEQKPSSRFDSQSGIFSKFSAPAIIKKVRPAILEPSKTKGSTFERLDELNKSGNLFDKLSKIGKSESTNDSIDKLSKFIELKKKGVFEKLPKAKVENVFDALSKKLETKIGKSALEQLSEMSKHDKKSKKDDIIKMLSTIKAPKKEIKNVFAAVLRFLLESKKISKNDISSLLFKLSDEGLISKGDVADVLYELKVDK